MTVQVGPDPQTNEQLAAIHTHSWPKSGTPEWAELFPDNVYVGGEGRRNDTGDLIPRESDKCCH